VLVEALLERKDSCPLKPVSLANVINRRNLLELGFLNGLLLLRLLLRLIVEIDIVNEV
jgi:hypothetical protein